MCLFVEPNALAKLAVAVALIKEVRSLGFRKTLFVRGFLKLRQVVEEILLLRVSRLLKQVDPVVLGFSRL